MSPAKPANVRLRQIEPADVPQVVELLRRGFGAARSRESWQYILTRLGNRSLPAGLPKYGYLLEWNGDLVGVILVICTTMWRNNKPLTRFNPSSFYVDPAYRVYAPLLAAQMFKHKGITVLNTSATQQTRALAEAQGYQKYCNGLFLTVPALFPAPDVTIRIVDGRTKPDAPFESYAHEMLIEHADFGCQSLWCVTPERAYPFVFRARTVKRILRGMHLVYCRNIDEFVRFGSPIGRFLARDLQYLVFVDADRPLSRRVGRYFHNRTPRYYRGLDPPHLGDLAYTEAALFGIFSGSRLTFESRRGFPADWMHASLAHANRNSGDKGGILHSCRRYRFVCTEN